MHKININDPLSFQKIYYHKEHLHNLLADRDTFPIHMELGLVNYCNHNCVFCYANRSKCDARKNQLVKINKTRLLEIVKEMSGLGLKSITLVGSGEPTLHPDASDIIRKIKGYNVEIGLFTNGSNLKDELMDTIVNCCTFIRFSLTGASEDIHSRVHGTSDYKKIIKNIEKMVLLRGTKPFPTIGIQFIIASYSAVDVVKGAEQAKSLGVDYYELKPCFLAPGKADQPHNKLSNNEAINLMNMAKKYETATFKVYAKKKQLEGVFADNNKRIYNKCFGSFTTVTLEPDYNLYICDNLKLPEFCFGNLKGQPFFKVWSSKRRKDVMSNIDVNNCPAFCRMHPLNTIIAQIRNGSRFLPNNMRMPDPPIHPNFL